ncbi:uncharacterized protein [Pseudorasbora parva]|uniref:uncharacterized protein isoform X1 n=1 Tax=Pseudorasbora parva TaxID=51549 RepID=UPI00351DD2B1
MDDRRSLSDCSDDSGSSDRSKDRPPPDPPDWSDDSGSSDRSKDRPPPDPPDCSDDSGSSDRSKDRPPPDPPDWSDDCSDYWSASEHSTDPPSFNHFILNVSKDLDNLFKNEYPQTQQCLDRLKTFAEDFRGADAGSQYGINSGIAGGVMMGLGIALAPFTLGASAVVAGAGAAVATGGLIARGVWNKKKSSMLTKFKVDFEAELNTFQNKIFCMNDKMKSTQQLIEKIMRDINNPKRKVSYLGTYFDSAYELSCFIRIYDVGGLAAKISETVRLIGAITGIIARVQSGLGRLSSSNGTKYHDTSRRDADMYVLHNLKSQMKELLEAYHRLKNVSRLIQEIVSGTQGAAQRPNLATILKETFMCLICRGVMERPVFTSCCRSVLGCKVCIDQWMENSRQCPKCRSEGVVITEVAGLSNVLEVTNSFV